MNCPVCDGVRMGCKFTAPVGRKSRFRVYRCGKCGAYEETYEVSTKLLPPTQEEVRVLQEEIAKVKAARFAFVKRRAAPK